MKAYTDIGQSKKLTEFLPLESADMTYRPIMDIDTMSNTGFLDTPDCYPFDEYSKNSSIKPLPCWSLVALFNVLPKDIEGSRLRIDIDNFDFSIWYDDLKGYGVNDELPDIISKEPVDACVSMIEKLHELKIL